MLKKFLGACGAIALVIAAPAMAQMTTVALPSGVSSVTPVEDVRDCGIVPVKWQAAVGGYTYTGRMSINFTAGEIAGYKIDQNVKSPSPDGDMVDYQPNGSTATFDSQTGFRYMVEVARIKDRCVVTQASVHKIEGGRQVQLLNTSG